MKRGIPTLACKKLLKSGGNLRISVQATDALRQLLNNRVDEIAILATKYAKHAGRKTILESDVQMAIAHVQRTSQTSQD
jgi:histone H3/H4